MYDIELYQTASGNVPLRRYFREIKKRFGPGEFNSIRLYVDLLAAHGMKINNYHPHSIRQIDGDLYELRPGNNRIFFFYFRDDTFVLLHAFRKQQQQTPKHEIDTARKRMEDHKRRNS